MAASALSDDQVMPGARLGGVPRGMPASNVVLPMVRENVVDDRLHVTTAEVENSDPRARLEASHIVCTMVTTVCLEATRAMAGGGCPTMARAEAPQEPARQGA